MSNMEEWRDVPNYEGYYQVSSLGRIRSLDRTVTTKHGVERFYKGGIRVGSVNNKGYKIYSLNINGVHRTFQGSQLVAMTFLGHEPDGHELVVDHINGDRSYDRLENLRVVSHRANVSTCFRSDRDSFSSGYAGVSWDEGASKWRTQIKHNGGHVYLGLYNSEIEASKAYQLALSKIKNGSFNPDDYKPKHTSKHKGVDFHKASNKWQARIRINGKQKYLGSFPTEIEAHNAYQKATTDKGQGSI